MKFEIDFSVCGLCKKEIRRLLELAEKNEKVRINIRTERGIRHLEVLD